VSQAIVVVSPFRASEKRSREEHEEHAKLLCRHLARAGRIVYAGHLLCPLFLDEDLASDREAGIAINLGWIERCDRLAIWDVWGITAGMKAEIEYAEKMNAENEWRQIAIHYFSKGEVPEWEDLHSRR
jgi:hypothetical protein